MNGFSDMHHHLVYGIDDGPCTFDEMTDMLSAAYQNRIARLIATPHACPGVKPFPYREYLNRLREAQEYCQEQGWPIRLYSGAEIMYTPMAAQMVVDGKIPSLARSKKVLVEFLPDVDLRIVEEAVRSFLRNGYIPILAHIERYDCLMQKPTNATRLKKDFHVFFQVNGSTIIHGRNGHVNRTIRSLLNEKLIDYVASDAHNQHTRPCNIKDAYRALKKQVDREYAQHLVGID